MPDPWSFRLFFSVDMAGSTAMKTRKMQAGDLHWSRLFELFYEDFPKRFFTGLKEVWAASQITPPGPDPTIWKFLGDEILFSIQVHDSEHIPVYLHAFKLALRGFCHIGQFREEGCGFKGTVWSAGFPLNNRMVTIENVVDYLGPSIDLGFRLCKFSSPRKLIVSHEVALMTAKHLHTNIKERSPWTSIDLQFRFDGMVKMKGVLDGAEYPLIWLDTTPRNRRTEEHLEAMLEADREPTALNISDYCREFIARHEETLIVPFIENDRSGLFSKIPESYNEKREQVYNDEKSAIPDNAIPLKDMDESPQPRPPNSGRIHLAGDQIVQD